MFLSAESERGSPKYCEGKENMGMFNSCDMCCWMASGILKNKSCDLARLKVVPDASLKQLRMDLSLLASCVVGVFRSTVSSTNWLWEDVDCNPCRGRH